MNDALPAGPKTGRKERTMKSYILITFYRDGTMRTDFFTKLEIAERYLKEAREKNLEAMIYQKMTQYMEQ